MIPMMRRNKGFTLVEIAIVVVIIGLLIGGVIKGGSLIQSAKVSSAITLAQDISVAVNAFKQQYHMLPGDMLINATAPEISNVRTECWTGGKKGNNNGLIDANESQCVPEVLFLAGLGKVDQDGGVPVFKSSYGPVTVKASTLSIGVTTSVAAGNPFPATHVAEFANLPCAVVQEMDRKMDNDILTSGKAVADLTGVADAVNPNTCAADSVVPSYAVAL